MAKKDQQILDALHVAKFALEEISCGCCTCAPEIEIDSEEKMCPACVAQRALASMQPTLKMVFP